MSKKIIFSLLFLLVFAFTKSLSAQNASTIESHRFVPAINPGCGTNTAAVCLSGIYLVVNREIVEWRTVSKTCPVYDQPMGCLVIHFNTLNQVGTKYLVTFAQIEWKGETKEFELVRVPIKSDKVLERQISESPISITLDN